MTKTTRHNCELIVFEHIKKSLSPSQLWKNNTLTKRQVDYALTKLRRAGFIEKISYGVWKALEEELTMERSHKTGKEASHVTLVHTSPKGTKPDSVRAHGVVMTVAIPKIENWDNREEILSRISPATEKPHIMFRKIPQGQRIFFNGCKIWLCNRSIVVYWPKKHSWFTETAPEAWRAIMSDTITLIKKLERHLKVGSNGFRMGKGYNIRPSRNHYSLIKNALAKQYKDDLDENGRSRKLFVYDDNGLWMIIDNSFNLEEAETVHPSTAVEDNVKVQNWFNGVKKTAITPEFILEGMNKLTNEQLSYRSDLAEYGQKIAAHAASIESLGLGITRLVDTIEWLEAKSEDLFARHGAVAAARPPQPEELPDAHEQMMNMQNFARAFEKAIEGERGDYGQKGSSAAAGKPDK